MQTECLEWRVGVSLGSEPERNVAQQTPNSDILSFQFIALISACTAERKQAAKVRKVRAPNERNRLSTNERKVLASEILVNIIRHLVPFPQ